MSNKTSERYSS